MKCAWKELLAILPPGLRKQLRSEDLWEIRLRLGQATQLVGARGSRWLEDRSGIDDLNFVINTASRYSPWTAQTMARGYITAAGGHRIGLAGEAVVNRGQVTGMRGIHSVCIRVARDVEGIGKPFSDLKGSVLILGPPGAGKTTLLRDLCREISWQETVAVVDERGELFPESFDRGRALDVLAHCPKPKGIDMALRTLGPASIAVDEITGEDDARALLRAGWSGVRLLATAHAAGPEDLKKRPIYRTLTENHLFDHILICYRDKSRPTERMDICVSNGSARCW